MGDHGFDTAFWNYPAVRPGVDYAPNREVLDPGVRWPGRAEFLRVPIGVAGTVPVELDLTPAGHGPHLVCAGDDGRNDLLRTILAGLVDRYSPDLVQFVVTDLDGLNEPLRGLPHTVTAFANPVAEPGRPPRDLARALEEEVRRRRGLPDLAAEPVLVLALEDVDRLVPRHPGLADALTALGRDGARLRMHLVVSVSTPAGPVPWPSTRITVAGGAGSLGGHGFRLSLITPEQLGWFASTFMYYHHPARPLWVPAGELTYDWMLARDRDPGAAGIPVGVRADGGFGTRRIDFSARSHLLVHGEPGCGKTTTLRTVRRGLAERHRDAVVLDRDTIAPVLDRIHAVLRGRAADRTAWRGPELFLVVDDYDGLLHPLADLLRDGSAIGVHAVVATTADPKTWPELTALPEDDRTAIALSGREAQRGSWDTPVSRFGQPSWEPVHPAPLGQALIGGHRVQIAVDGAEWPPGSVAALETPGGPDRAADLTVVLGETEDSAAARIDVRQHTWCGGSDGEERPRLLRRIGFALADRHPPTRVQFLVAGADVRELRDIAVLPHTAEHLRTTDPTKDGRRLAALLDDEIRRRLAADAPDTPHLVVLVDDAGSFTTAVPAVGATLRRVAEVGERLGVSLVVGQRTIGDALAGVHERAGNRVSLADISDDLPPRTLGVSELPRPRRGTAHLRVGDGEPRFFTLADVRPEEIRAARFRPRGPAVRARPLSPPVGTFTHDELLHIVAAQPEEFSPIPLGLLDSGERPVGLDFGRVSHFVVAGGPGSGRSTVLRTVLRGLARRYTVAECAVLLLHDNEISGVLPAEYVLATSAGFKPPAEMLDDVVKALRKRVGATWSGPRLFVVIDDLDSFAADQDPLVALSEFLPHAAAIELHFVVSGRSEFLMRAAVADLGFPRLLLGEETVPAVPGLPAVGNGVLMPWRWPVTLPWSGGQS